MTQPTLPLPSTMPPPLLGGYHPGIPPGSRRAYYEEGNYGPASVDMPRLRSWQRTDSSRGGRRSPYPEHDAYDEEYVAQRPMAYFRRPSFAHHGEEEVGEEKVRMFGAYDEFDRWSHRRPIPHLESSPSYRRAFKEGHTAVYSIPREGSVGSNRMRPIYDRGEYESEYPIEYDDVYIDNSRGYDYRDDYRRRYDFRDEIDSVDSWQEEQWHRRRLTPTPSRESHFTGRDFEHPKQQSFDRLEDALNRMDHGNRGPVSMDSLTLDKSMESLPARRFVDPSDRSYDSGSRRRSLKQSWSSFSNRSKASSAHSSVRSRGSKPPTSQYREGSFDRDDGSAPQKSRSTNSNSSRSSSRRRKQTNTESPPDSNNSVSSGGKSWKLEKKSSVLSDGSKMSNPQLLHAKSIPELPEGYLQRKDGVIISFGSSVASSKQPERYADPNYHPVEAAQNVVDNLRSLGYNIDEANGILGSNSDCGNNSRYGGAPSLSTGGSDVKSNSASMSVNSGAARTRSIKNSTTSNFGVVSPPAVASRAKVSGDKGSHSSGSKDSDSVFRAKVKTSRGRGSTTENGSSTSAGSSKSESYTETKDSTMLADGSTLTTKVDGTLEQEGTVLLDATGMPLPASFMKEESKVATLGMEPTSYSTKRVNFSGEYPPLTSDGGRVPELVLGLNTIVSDITHQRSHGGTSVSSVTFHQQTTDPVESLFDKILYSCRISAFPSART